LLFLAVKSKRTVMTKFVSWNVNGIRATVGKGFDEVVKNLDADFFCIQETKAQDDQVAEALGHINGYHLYSNSATKKGYSGTAILARKQPLKVLPDIGIAEHDNEGRVTTLEYENFFLVNVYVPNSGSDLKRLGYRQTWDAAFLNYLKNLEKSKPVIVCGDLNVAHKPIDLARPKENYNKSAGFMQEEIDGMDAYTSNGFTDTFRYLYPDGVQYTWWSFRGGARERNVGWRIDYFLVSEALNAAIKNAEIHDQIMGSDHCPVSLVLDI
jgi:exodeoxyribonuclease III